MDFDCLLYDLKNSIKQLLTLREVLGSCFLHLGSSINSRFRLPFSYFVFTSLAMEIVKLILPLLFFLFWVVSASDSHLSPKGVNDEGLPILSIPI